MKWIVKFIHCGHYIVLAMGYIVKTKVNVQQITAKDINDRDRC